MIFNTITHYKKTLIRSTFVLLFVFTAVQCSKDDDDHDHDDHDDHDHAALVVNNRSNLA